MAKKGETTSSNEQKDEGFKTCQSVVHTPGTKRVLRMTAARTSFMSGGTPFKEVVSSGKKFNSRKKSKKANGDISCDSNETFIRHERDVYDRDSLDVLRSPPVYSSPTKIPELTSSPLPSSISSPAHIPQPPASSPRAKVTKPKLVATKKLTQSVQPKSKLINKRLDTGRRLANMRKPIIRRKPLAPPPPPTTTSRRVNSYKSTAEIEKEYWNTLRSRF